MREPVRLINTKAHAIVDYVMGMVLLCSPAIFQFDFSGPEYYTAATAGLITIVLALFTAFEYGALKTIPLRLHLYIDMVTGAALAASPWLMDFAGTVFKPHLVFGLSQVIVAVLTDRLLYHNVKGSNVKETTLRHEK
jgi:hypothetical protein